MDEIQQEFFADQRDNLQICVQAMIELFRDPVYRDAAKESMLKMSMMLAVAVNDEPHGSLSRLLDKLP